MLDFFLQPFSIARRPAILALNDLAALGPVREPRRNQMSRLMRHFLERFFNHESASHDGDAKTRLVQIACAAGLPGFMVALYLDPVYHHADPPPYWLQVNHHLFFVLYSFVAMGIAMVFEWDMFFPDLLDIQILKTLPVKDGNVFFARVAAIALLVAGFLFDSNFLPPTIIHITMNPPNHGRFTMGHILAVSASGLFAAMFILALQGLLLSVLGDRVFRRLSLLLQGLLIALLVILLLLFPSFSGMLPIFLQSGNFLVLCFPPFWFLGLYQRFIEGSHALPIFTTLAKIGFFSTLAAIGLTMLTYPIAYTRRTRQVIEGPGKRGHSGHLIGKFSRGLAAVFDRLVLRIPIRLAVHHFISQTLLRVSRYRIYLVLYGGVGLSVVVSTVLHFTVVGQRIVIETSADGIRAAIAIVAFWTIAGLRIAFVPSGNQQGNWIFRVLQGRPPEVGAAMEMSYSAQLWALLWSSLITIGICLSLHVIAPPELRTASATAAQLTFAVGFCLLLSDVFFLNVTTVAFSGDRPRETSNLAFTVLKYFTVFPVVVWLPLGYEPWIEDSGLHLCFAAAAIAAVHLCLRAIHRAIVEEYSDCPALEDDEEGYPIRLGLRY
jgi:hypothetical protein